MACCEQNCSHTDADIPIVYTECLFQNQAGQCLTLYKAFNIHGHGDPQKTIQDKETGEFKHFPDSEGLVGVVEYILEHKLKWVVAWSNIPGKPDKVYTQILEMKEGIDLVKIKFQLDFSGNQSCANKLGYSAEAIINSHTDIKPTMKATLKPADPSLV
ncbi:uncharacterized protein LOC128292762 [Gossypium arboreum]|uniref:Uncharacterized protein n=3 Tax=Gossypium TaxID=3633 RepID=A0ABR0Q154_GOSAR|nr:uncharacterized protein LOC107902504 [Gossypium hirsutum]XP_052883649.1 uncharacterized protein LOC128292762 [Gossypium arboreum]KAK5832917.1 hypothetical protein PVK06_016725 [Gossypium arboreum]